MNMAGPLTLIMAAFAVISAVFTVMALVAVRRRRVIGTAMAMLLGLLCLTLAALAGSVSLATHGYRALTHEVVAATVATRVTGPQQFTATFTFADGRRSSFELTGDAIAALECFGVFGCRRPLRAQVEQVHEEVVGQ